MKRKAFAVGVRLKPQETSVIITMFSVEPPEWGFNNLSWVSKLRGYSTAEQGIKSACSSVSSYKTKLFANWLVIS